MKAVTAEIDMAALVGNLRQIRTYSPHSKMIAVVKANAYGHGLYPVASALDDEADAFAVARLDEALSLRNQGITKPIVLLEGFFDAGDLHYISRYELYTAVHEEEQVRAIELTPTPKPIHAWMTVNIGMQRLGFNPEEIGAAKARLEACDHVLKPLGLISHLSVADTAGQEDFTREQIECFFKTARDFSFTGDLSLANSAGTLLWPQSHTPWVRPGIILYGISPFEDKVGSDFGLTPAMTLKSRIIAIRHLKRGDRVGYGAAFTAERPTTLAIVAAGYGDGYPRTAPNGTPVLINGRLVPTAGHVCMDMLFVDLGENAPDQVGDPVVLWGPGLPVEKIAERCGTIPWELVCRVMPRVGVRYH